MMKKCTRRTFAMLTASTIGAVAFPARPGSATPEKTASTPAAGDEKLESEFLFVLTLDTQPPHSFRVGDGSRLIVPVSGGTFEGPRLKGTIIPPGGDWIVQRADGSRLLDVRVLFQTNDQQSIYVSWRGVAFTAPDGALYARILPLFETGSTQYAWLNNVVAVGVYRGGPGKIAYRVYRIL